MIDYIRKNILFIIGFFVVLLLILHFLILNTYYSINLKTEQPTSEPFTVDYLDSSATIKQSTQILGIFMVPRNADTLIIKSGDKESRTAVQNKAIIGINSLTVNLKTQRELSKLGRGGLSCNGVDSTSKQFTYACYGSSDTVIVYPDKKKGMYENRTLSTILSKDRLVTKPYTGGLLSITPLEGDTYLEYIDVAQDTSIQQSLPYISSDLLSLYTNPSSSAFLVVNNTTHEVLFYKSLSSQGKKLAFSRAINYTTCSVSSSTFTCVAAEPANNATSQDDGDSHSADSTLLKNVRLVTYKTDSKEQSSRKLSKSIESVCETNNGTYTIDSSDQLLFTPRAKDDLYVIASNVITFACNDTSSFYTDGKSLYKTEGGSSWLYLKENHLDIASIYTNGKRVIINTTVAGEVDPITHTYEVTETPLSAKRIEDILPYPEGGRLPILEMDYDNENIYIKPQLSVTSDKQTGRTTIDESALSQVKDVIEAKLEEDNIAGRRKIIYYLY